MHNSSPLYCTAKMNHSRATVSVNLCPSCGSVLRLVLGWVGGRMDARMYLKVGVRDDAEKARLMVWRRSRDVEAGRKNNGVKVCVLKNSASP